MNQNTYISLFDFIALLLSELKANAFSRYAGLRIMSYYPDTKSKAFIDKFIEVIKQDYTSRDEDYHDYILLNGIPYDIYTEFINNKEFRDNLDAVYKLASELAKHFINDENLLSASQRAYDLAKAQNLVGFKALNSDQSIERTGYLLLPDLGTFGDSNKINKTTTKFEKIHLNKLIVLTLSDLKTRVTLQFEVKNVLSDKNSHLFRKKPKDPLVIAVSPICDRWLLKDAPVLNENEFGTTEYYFEIEGLTDTDFITKRVKEAYKVACENHSDILLFPEMYGFEDLSLRPDEIIDNVDEDKSPITIMPSWWHDKCNEAPILDDSLTPLYYQQKYSPFLYRSDKLEDKKYSLENLQNNNHLLYVYHIPKIGRLCVCICKDFLMDSYRRMLYESLEASLILVPAFSPKTEHFVNCMDELKHAGTYGIFVNCCAALSYKDDVYSPISNKYTVGEVTVTKTVREDSKPSYKLLKPTCNGDCGGPESRCTFIIKITDNGDILVDHIHGCIT